MSALRVAAIGVVAVVCIAAVASGCSKVGTSAGTAANGRHTWTEPGVLRVVSNQEPNSLIRLFSNQAAADDMTALLFEPMFRYDEHGNPVPSLATEFPTQENGLISKDGLRITFKLRRNARWSDGAPVTSADVIYTWHAIVDGENPVVTTAGFDGIKTMIADGPHEVTMVLKKPYGPSVYLFSEGSFPPLPSHLLARYKRIDRLPYDSDPVGDGPYVLKQWIHGSDLIFTPNPYYWRGPPKLKEVDVRIIPDSVTDVSELKTHEIDVLDGVSKNLVGQLASIDGIRVVKQLTANYRHLDFNLHNPILADVVVRRAIAQSVDFDKIIRDVYHGLGVRGATVIPPMSWAANDYTPLPYDPAGARAALDADGWKVGPGGIRMRGGVRLSLSMSTATENLPNQMAEQIVAAELHDVGVEVTIKNYATSILFAPDGPLYGDKYDMAWIVNTEGTDPDFLGLIGCRYMPPHGANTDFYCNPKVDALLEDAQVHYDFAVRKRDYDQASKILIDEVPYVVVYWDVNVVAENTDVKNYKPSPFITDFWNAWEWEI